MSIARCTCRILLLPPALLPEHWVGASHELCRQPDAQLFTSAEAHLSLTARRLTRALPRATRAAQARFGGLALNP